MVMLRELGLGMPTGGIAADHTVRDGSLAALRGGLRLPGDVAHSGEQLAVRGVLCQGALQHG